MDIFSLVARLTLDKSNYDQGLDDASKGAQTFGQKLRGGLKTATKIGATAIAAVGTAAAAATTALVKQSGEVASYGDNIDKASQKLGISAEAYQEWDAVLQHSGTSIDSMGIGMKTLANAAATGSDAFAALGISAEQAASMSREDLFAQTITALQNVTDENQRAQLAQELFGRSAMELGPLLNTSAKDTEAMRKRVHALGGVMSKEAVKASAAYQDSLQDMQTAIDGTKRNLVSEFLPSLTTVMDGVTEVFTTGGTEKLSQGIEAFVNKFSEMVPRVMEIGSQILLTLSGAIVENLPTLIDSAVQMVLTIGTGLIEQLPSIVEAGLQVIVSLAQGIADALPELVPTIVDVVLQIVDILTQPDTLSALVDASIAIIVALAEGLIDALPKLIEKAPEIITNLVTAIIQNAPKILQAGIDLMGKFAEGIVNGISSAVSAIGQLGEQIFSGIGDIVSKAWQWGADMIDNFTEGLKAMISKPIDAVKGLAGKISSFLGFSVPDEGPLADFDTYAPDMMKLFAEGIESNKGLITDAISSSFAISPGMNMAAGQEYTVPRAAAQANTDRPMYMVLDGQVFARVISGYLDAEQQRRGVRLATGGAL